VNLGYFYILHFSSASKSQILPQSKEKMKRYVASATTTFVPESSSRDDLVDPAVAGRVVSLRRAQDESWGFLTRRNKFPLVVGQAGNQTGLCVNDIIELINGRRPRSYDEALLMIRSAGAELDLTVSSPVAAEAAKQAPQPPRAPYSSSDAVSAPKGQSNAEAAPSAKQVIKTCVVTNCSFNVDTILKYIPRVAPSVIYDRQHCPFTAADGFSDTFHDKLQDFITMRALGATGASADRIVAMQGRGHVRTVQELVHYIGTMSGVQGTSATVDMQAASRQHNTLCAMLGDLKQARDERAKDDAEVVAKRRAQAMENFRAVQRMSEESQPGAGSSSFSALPVVPGPSQPFPANQVLSIIRSYFGPTGGAVGGRGVNEQQRVIGSSSNNTSNNSGRGAAGSRPSGSGRNHSESSKKWKRRNQDRGK
jgi:hypothetical protein